MASESRSYTQMTLAVREEISRGLAARFSHASIALLVGYSSCSIGREVRRHSVAEIGYRAHWAQARADDAAGRKGRHRKLDAGPLWNETCRHLKSGLSPEQVSSALKRDFADNTAMQVSHETIYQALYVLPRNALKAVLVQEGLRQHHERPAEVDTRTVPGHWEGDLIKGEKNRSEVGVLLERQSRRVVLARLTDARAVTVREAFEAAFRVTPPELIKTLTYDQGSEMAEHAKLAANANISIYFADAHSPWQKGAIENANGLLRQYLPKGTNLAKHTQAQLDVIAEKLNNRLRECLDWKTPNEVWAEMVNNVALKS